MQQSIFLLFLDFANDAQNLSMQSRGFLYFTSVARVELFWENAAIFPVKRR